MARAGQKGPLIAYDLAATEMIQRLYRQLPHRTYQFRPGGLRGVVFGREAVGSAWRVR